MASPKIVFITGGNSAIGYEAVKALLQSDKSYHILLGSRTLEKANGAIESLHAECPESHNILEAMQLDLTSDESIAKAFEQVKASHGKLDVLVNNGAVSLDRAYLNSQLSLRACFTNAYDVNVAGTHVLSHTFIPLLLQSSDPRLVFVGGFSQITRAADEAYFPGIPPQPAGWPKKLEFETIGYRCSKTAMNMLMLDYHYKLKADGVKVWSVGPGMCVTNLGNPPEGVGEAFREKLRAMGAQHPSQGGEIIRRVVEGERDADVGKFVVKDGGFAAW